MKKLSLLLALVLMLVCVAGAFAEESSGEQAPGEEPISAAEVMNVRAEEVDEEAAEYHDDD